MKRSERQLTMSSRKKIAIIALFLVTVAVFGFDKESRSEEQQNIRIGSMFIMSGPLEGYGRHGQQGIELAIQEINAAGGVLGKQLEALFRDEAGKSPEEAALVAEELILKEKADFLIAPTSSKIAPAVSEVAKKHKTIQVLAQSAAPVLTGDLLHPYIFSTLSNAMMHSRSGAQFAASKPYKRWMCVGPDYNYGHSSWEVFKTRLLELRPDVEIVGESFPAFLKTKDYTPYIKEVLGKKPDAVWCPLWGIEAVNFIKQGMKYDLFSKVKIFFPVGAALDVLLPMGEEMPEGLYMSTRYFFTTPHSDMNRNFVDTYLKKFNEYPDYMAGESYAAVYFLKAAIERAGSIDSDTVVQAVEKEPLAWETPEGWKIMRVKDHAAVEDCVWGETSHSDKYDFAILANIQSIQGEEICRTAEELEQIKGSSPSTPVK